MPAVPKTIFAYAVEAEHFTRLDGKMTEFDPFLRIDQMNCQFLSRFALPALYPTIHIPHSSYLSTTFGSSIFSGNNTVCSTPPKNRKIMLTVFHEYAILITLSRFAAL